jgi:pimeloyl-ACP methyl ester carboxylesterase
MLAMPFLKTEDGTSLYYTDWGHGRPVVLIQGWPLSSAFWEYQASFLAEHGFRVVAYDRRGFGKSDQPWHGYDYDTLADDLAALIRQLDLRQATLVGFSMGGGEVARYLARHGTERIAQAVLLGAVTPFLLRTEDNPDGVRQSVFDEIIEGLEQDRPGFLASFAKSVFKVSGWDKKVSGDIDEWFVRDAMQGSRRATIECARAWSATDFRRDMAAFTLPTLICHGGRDSNVKPEISGRESARLVPHARYIEYEDSGHGIIVTDRHLLNADLLGFLGDTTER